MLVSQLVSDSARECLEIYLECLLGDSALSLSSRLPFWRSGNVPWTMPIKLGRWFLEVPGTPEIGELVELLALIFENSRTSTSIYISK